MEELDLHGDAINIDIHFCREQVPCLQFALKPRSVVVIGARKCWWRRRERKLERDLKRMGHDVLPVNIAADEDKTQSTAVIDRLQDLLASGSLNH